MVEEPSRPEVSTAHESEDMFSSRRAPGRLPSHFEQQLSSGRRPSHFEPQPRGGRRPSLFDQQLRSATNEKAEPQSADEQNAEVELRLAKLRSQETLANAAREAFEMLEEPTVASTRRKSLWRWGQIVGYVSIAFTTYTKCHK